MSGHVDAIPIKIVAIDNEVAMQPNSKHDPGILGSPSLRSPYLLELNGGAEDAVHGARELDQRTVAG